MKAEPPKENPIPHQSAEYHTFTVLGYTVTLTSKYPYYIIYTVK